MNMTTTMAALLLVLSTVDGHPVLVNPAHITSLRPARNVPEKDKFFPGGAQCMVNLADGKFVNVRETCDAIRSLLEGSK